ncbi:MAG TPA: hypothetical protein VK780_08290, partial [Thermoanaerobaculia bacterium]|nr:hypothetical protein [Thermoanaerobaculia bacterium]
MPQNEAVYRLSDPSPGGRGVGLQDLAFANYDASVRRGLSILLLGLPAAVVSKLLGAPDWVTLSAAALALVPLAEWIAVATEHLTVKVGVG